MEILSSGSAYVDEVFVGCVSLIKTSRNSVATGSQVLIQMTHWLRYGDPDNDMDVTWIKTLNLHT